MFARLGRNVHQFRHAGLHPIGKFVLTDPRGDFGIADVGQLRLIQLIDGVDDSLCVSWVDTRWDWTGTEPDHLCCEIRRLGKPLGRNPLPQAGLPAPSTLPVIKTTNPGKSLILGPQSVVQPRSDARSAEPTKPAEHEHLRGTVIELVGVQRLDQRDLVGDRLQMRQQIRNRQARTRRTV